MNLEEWQKSVLVGAILLILAVLFAVVRNEVNIWIVLIIILAAIDIALGLLRKKKGV